VNGPLGRPAAIAWQRSVVHLGDHGVDGGVACFDRRDGLLEDLGGGHFAAADQIG